MLFPGDFNAGIENEPQNCPVSSSVRCDIQVFTATTAIAVTSLISWIESRLLCVLSRKTVILTGSVFKCQNRLQFSVHPV
jgi:hypothetical protein